MLQLLNRGALFLVCLTMLAPVAAQNLPADCPKRPDDAEQVKKLAGEWFARGDKLVEQKRDGEALGAFSCSLRMIEHPATLFNAAQAARLSSHGKEALRLYRRFVELVPDDRLAGEARSHIKDLEDAARPEKADPRKPPEVTVLRPEARPVEKGAAEEPAAERQPVDKGRVLEISGYATLGIGGAAAVVGAVLQGLAYKASNADAKAADTLGEYNDLKEERDGFQTGAIVGFVVGGAAIGAGIAMVLFGRKMEPKDGTKTAFSVRPGPNGLWISGAF